MIAARLREATAHRVEVNNSAPVLRRLARALCILADQYGVPVDEGVLIAAPLSQADMGSLISTTEQSVRRALDADTRGAQAFIVAAADTVMRRPSRELMAEVFPGVPVGDQVAEHGTLLGIDEARRVLGYDPTFSWRELF